MVSFWFAVVVGPLGSFVRLRGGKVPQSPPSPSTLPPSVASSTLASHTLYEHITNTSFTDTPYDTPSGLDDTHEQEMVS